MYYEDVEVGKVYKSDAGKTVTGSEIDLVCQMSGLDLPGFLDPDVAKGWGFKDRVTPGPYVLACMFGLMSRQGFLSNAIWMGAKEIALKSPVFPRDKISAEVEVLDKKPAKRGGGPVTYAFRVKNQEGKLICEGVSTCLFAGKPAAE
jgi:3-hydroxybutyryl-CoA dehydratase